MFPKLIAWSHNSLNQTILLSRANNVWTHNRVAKHFFNHKSACFFCSFWRWSLKTMSGLSRTEKWRVLFDGYTIWADETLKLLRRQVLMNLFNGSLFFYKKQWKAWQSKVGICFNRKKTETSRHLSFFFYVGKISFKFPSHKLHYRGVISYWLHNSVYRQAIEINIYDIIIRF